MQPYGCFISYVEHIPSFYQSTVQGLPTLVDLIKAGEPKLQAWYFIQRGVKVVLCQFRGSCKLQETIVFDICCASLMRRMLLAF